MSYRIRNEEEMLELCKAHSSSNDKDAVLVTFIDGVRMTPAKVEIYNTILPDDIAEKILNQTMDRDMKFQYKHLNWRRSWQLIPKYLVEIEPDLEF